MIFDFRYLLKYLLIFKSLILHPFVLLYGQSEDFKSTAQQ